MWNIKKGEISKNCRFHRNNPINRHKKNNITIWFHCRDKAIQPLKNQQEALWGNNVTENKSRNIIHSPPFHCNINSTANETLLIIGHYKNSQFTDLQIFSKYHDLDISVTCSTHILLYYTFADEIQKQLNDFQTTTRQPNWELQHLNQHKTYR